MKDEVLSLVNDVCSLSGEDVNGVTYLFFPKFHCVLNYIEIVWAYMRHCLRRDCDFNYKHMHERMEELCAPPCFRFMDGYRKRSLPESLTNKELFEQYEEYRLKKEEKLKTIRRMCARYVHTVHMLK